MAKLGPAGSPTQTYSMRLQVALYRMSFRMQY
jgi:hypothetical protein